ncbi:hypothetical protein [Ralstonia pseudosolanacearum]|uniref:hypothetical protein n=1 Tax=Ralstonia pseudosolanacearum TaxID=1310165 RepID=UPI00339226C5
MSETLTRADVVEKLTAIRKQMRELIGNASDLLKAGGFGSALDRAEDYWIADLTRAISRHHRYVGRSAYTLQDTIEEIERCEDEDDFEDDDVLEVKEEEAEDDWI